MNIFERIKNWILLNVSSDTVITVLRLCSVALFAFAFIMFIYAIQRKPYASQRKNLSLLSKKAIVREDFLDKIIKSLALIFKRFIKIGEFKRIRLATQFEMLEIKMTPEEYYADMYAKVFLLALFIPIAFIIHWAIGLFAIVAIVMVVLLMINKIDSVMEARKDAIESELPNFVSVIEQTFKIDHDVIKLISTYVKNSDTPLAKELSIALADMKTGDFEIALNRLSNRVNSVYLSEVVRGLQSALHGDDTVGYFASLNSKIWDNEKVKIRKKALKTPGKVKYLVKVMLGMMFVIYIVVFGTVIYEGLADIFTMM